MKHKLKQEQVWNSLNNSVLIILFTVPNPLKKRSVSNIVNQCYKPLKDGLDEGAVLGKGEEGTNTSVWWSVHTTSLFW